MIQRRQLLNKKKKKIENEIKEKNQSDENVGKVAHY